MSSERDKIHQVIDDYAQDLKLPSIRKYFAPAIKEAEKNESSYEVFLMDLLQKEWDQWQQSGKESRIRLANFPFKRYLEDLIVEDLPEDARKKLKTLTTLDFIKQNQNLILAGNPGTGKTHLAIGLGIRACMEGYRVLFTTIPLLINQLKESRSNRILQAFGNKFAKYDLVIADELGYISFDKEGSELLFTHLSLRSGHKSTIITTNLSFDRWSEIFHDPVMTAAMVDRMTHKSYMINMNGNSFRLKETKAWLAQ
jgi:DNA replication protein DnaC